MLFVMTQLIMKALLRTEHIYVREKEAVLPVDCLHRAHIY